MSSESEFDSQMDEEDFLSGSQMDDESNDEEMDYDDDFIDLKTERGSSIKSQYNFKVQSLTDIENKQHEITDRVSSLLGLDKSRTAALLHAYKWHDDSLIERYIEDPDKVLKNSGVAAINYDDDDNENTPTASSRSSGEILKPEKDFLCFICCCGPDDNEDMMTFSLSCGHRACLDCYRYYLTQKITQEGESRVIRCPGDSKCGLLVDEAAVKMIVTSETYKRYRRALVETFIDENELFHWCPAPGCDFAIECNVRKHDLSHYVPTVKCNCDNVFCFGCGESDHQPATCFLARKWRKKCADDSETSNWISANTKDCPTCHSMIEKNGGCNHMTCKKCRHEFCWICMGAWSAHGSSFYNCSRYDSVESEKARTQQEKSRATLERYLHYYNRYSTHLQSIKLEKDSFNKMQAKMKELQQESGLSWIQVQFLNQTFAVLIESRHTLTWAYAFAFYLQKSNMTTIFEDNQRDLELAVENLSELLEKPVSDIAEKKIQLLDKCTYVSNRRVILLEHAAKGLADGTWDFNIDMEE